MYTKINCNIVIGTSREFFVARNILDTIELWQSFKKAGVIAIQNNPPDDDIFPCVYGVSESRAHNKNHLVTVTHFTPEEFKVQCSAIECNARIAMGNFESIMSEKEEK